MSADTLLGALIQILFVLIFIVVLRRALRSPLRANIDTALLFGVLSLIIAQGWVLALLHRDPPRVLTILTSQLLMLLPYLLLRLVQDFARVPRLVMRIAEVGAVLSLVGLIAFAKLPGLLVLVYVAYFVWLQVYAAQVFVREARRSRGVTRRRMQAVATGSFLLGFIIFLAGLQAVAPVLGNLWLVLSQAAALGSGLAWFVGFAPPVILRRAWQEPELRSFLSRAASLPRLPTTEAIIEELERGTAASIGVVQAQIGLWDADRQALCFRLRGSWSGLIEAARDLPDQSGVWVEDGCMYVREGHMIAGRVLAAQQPMLTVDAEHDDPLYAPLYRAGNIAAVLSAPITAGSERLGVARVYAATAPVFVEDDLLLLTLLADQAAVILESRRLIDEAARVRAREEVVRLKDDFLSAAAHDLKTPLTTLVAQAQLLQRRARRSPEAPADSNGIDRMVREAERLRSLVLELLDAARAEQGRLVGDREPVDLDVLAAESVERARNGIHTITLETEPIHGLFDRNRVMQLIDNFLENAIKYSPDGGTVRVRLVRQAGDAWFSVEDQGIGVPADDLPHLFDRFHRGSNVDDKRFSGMGLGLYICRGIVEEHGGQIWATSTPGRGSVFHARFPILEESARPAPAPSGTSADGVAVV